MIRLFLLLPFTLINFWSVYAQKPTLPKYPSFSLEVAGGLTNSFMYKTPVGFILCIEGCHPYQQDMLPGKSLLTSVGMSLNRRHRFSLGVNFHGIGYQEELVDGFGGGTFDNTQKWKVIGFEMSHHFTVLQGEKLRIALVNGFELDHLKNEHFFDELKVFAPAFVVKLGIEYDLIPRIAVKGYPFFKTALSKYNREDSITSYYNDYYPYTYGLLLGLSFRI